jgi:ribonuclease HI
MGLSVVVEADGACRGNPGPAAYGVVVVDAATEAVLAERKGAIGEATNNVAEYRALVEGLRAAAELGATDVLVRMDSQLVVNQMTGAWNVEKARLQELHAEAGVLAGRFDAVQFEWVRREFNGRADALANQALG